MTEPQVSVVMAVFDAEPALLRSALQSVLAQTLETIELIVVEDPSRRSAEGLVAEYPDPRVRYHRNDIRQPLPDSLNLGLSLARAELVARFNAADLCERDRLEKQVRYLKRYPEVSVLGSQVAVIGRDGQPLAYTELPCEHAAIIAALPRFNPLVHSSVVFLKSVVVGAGGYRLAIHEDYDLWSRLAALGAQFANHPHRLVKHRLRDEETQLLRLPERLRTEFEIKRKYWWKQMGWPARLAAYIMHCAASLPPKLAARLAPDRRLDHRAARKRRKKA